MCVYIYTQHMYVHVLKQYYSVWLEEQGELQCKWSVTFYFGPHKSVHLGKIVWS